MYTKTAECRNGERESKRKRERESIIARETKRSQIILVDLVTTIIKIKRWGEEMTDNWLLVFRKLERKEREARE